jgi:hypothetical protein
VSIRVHVQENYAAGGLDVWVAEKGDGRRTVLRPDGAWTTAEPGTTLTDPSLRVPEGAGRALLEALARHYEGGEDTRALRRDYDAERARVDSLVGVLARTVERASAALPVAAIPGAA